MAKEAYFSKVKIPCNEYPEFFTKIYIFSYKWKKLFVII